MGHDDVDAFDECIEDLSSRKVNLLFYEILRLCCVLRVLEALGGSFVCILRVWDARGRSRFWEPKGPGGSAKEGPHACGGGKSLGGSGKLNLSYFSQTKFRLGDTTRNQKSMFGKGAERRFRAEIRLGDSGVGVPGFFPKRNFDWETPLGFKRICLAKVENDDFEPKSA